MIYITFGDYMKQMNNNDTMLFDIVFEDKIFAKYLYEKYKEDVMMCNINFNDIEVY